MKWLPTVLLHTYEWEGTKARRAKDMHANELLSVNHQKGTGRHRLDKNLGAVLKTSLECHVSCLSSMPGTILLCGILQTSHRGILAKMKKHVELTDWLTTLNTLKLDSSKIQESFMVNTFCMLLLPCWTPKAFDYRRPLNIKTSKHHEERAQGNKGGMWSSMISHAIRRL